ncbi:hypothetical protein PIB30_046070 [Stylosanthes scabra]|uniref:Uncharacterized protein n=1 Tax=Stylosanthes scabra TaxID=79078 RepID=A0ABU6TGQ3_9FABA|nr:hypothetical protein [Stylosanthes scabra]
MTRSLLHDGIGTCSHALLRNLRTCTQVLPPPVSLEIHRLDSLQQPKLGADWAHLVLHSPRNIGAVAGDLSRGYGASGKQPSPRKSRPPSRRNAEPPDGHNGRLDRLEQELAQQREEYQYFDLHSGDPFSEEIMKAKVPKNFKNPDMVLYDGTSDPCYHLSNFRSWMYLAGASDATRCKAFPTTLTKVAQI